MTEKVNSKYTQSILISLALVYATRVTLTKLLNFNGDRFGYLPEIGSTDWVAFNAIIYIK